MRLTDPAYLVLGGALVWFWLAGVRRGADRRRIAARCLVALLLVLAASGLQYRAGDAPLSVMFVLDQSASVGRRMTGALGTLQAATHNLRPGDRAGLIVFGADAAIERRLDGTALSANAPASRTVDSATNIEAALRLARATLPATGGRRIVLLSDGRETAGRALLEASASAGAGIPIDVMPLAGGGAAPATVTRLAAPPTVHAGEPFDVVATVQGTPGESAEVVLTGAGAPPATRRVVLSPDGRAAAAFTERQAQQGIYVYRATLRATDLDADVPGEDAGAGAVVSVAGEPQLLYVSAGGGAIVDARSGYRVQRAAPSAVPRAAGALAAFDAVVLDDVPEELLDRAQQLALAEHVERAGAGLLVLGSPRSLAAGTPADETLAALLPVDLRPRRGARAPGMALVVVFDKSGSMDDRIAGVPRIEIARQAVQRVLASVPATDAIGVIAFDAAAADVAPLQPGYDAAGLGARLRAVRPAGATAIAPALERALDWLRAAAGGSDTRRHVLLVSDGRTSPADGARALAALRSARGIQVSTVALGDEADRALLTALAQTSGGRALFPQDARALPGIVAREAARVSGGRVVEEPFTVGARTHEVLSGIDTSAMPRLGGYVVGTIKPGAEIILGSPLGDPILAGWRRGLGKVAVYMADLQSPWSAGLRAWNQAGPLFGQTTRWISRRLDHPFLHPRFTADGGRLQVLVEAQTTDGVYLNQLDVRATARTPDGGSLDVPLRASAPGLYEGNLPLGEQGPYVFTITATGGGVDASLQRGFFWSAPGERPGAPDSMLLAGVAATTGGRLLASNDNPFASDRPADYRNAAPWLAGAALLTFLIDLLGPSVATIARRAEVPHRDTRARKDAA